MKGGYIWAVSAGIFGGLCTMVAVLLYIQNDPRDGCLTTFLILGAAGLGTCIGLLTATIAQGKSHIYNQPER